MREWLFFFQFIFLVIGFGKKNHSISILRIHCNDSLIFARNFFHKWIFSLGNNFESLRKISDSIWNDEKYENFFLEIEDQYLRTNHIDIKSFQLAFKEAQSILWPLNDLDRSPSSIKVFHQIPSGRFGGSSESMLNYFAVFCKLRFNEIITLWNAFFLLK